MVCPQNGNGLLKGLIKDAGFVVSETERLPKANKNTERGLVVREPTKNRMFDLGTLFPVVEETIKI